MRLVSRSVLREIWPPFLLGFVAYTFILLIRTILFLADFAVRRSASFLEVARLVGLSLPWIVVLTLPMALLLGVLIGIGRLSSDSELTALGACGVGLAALYRPVLGAAAALSVVVLLVYNAVLPATNAALERSMARVAASSIVNVVAPRTFREPRPGITFFFDRIAADGRSFQGIFLTLGDESEAPNRVIVARRGGLTLEGDRLWLDLFESTVHELDPQDPSRYRTTRNASQRLLLAGEAVNSAGARVTSEKGIRARTLPELVVAAERLPKSDPRRRQALVEIHKKLAIPFACLAFALVGIPLAQSLRRAGRGGDLALSLLILIGYYVLLSTGETWASDGRLPPALAMWLPNVLVVAIGAAAALSRRERRALAAPRPLAESPPPAGAQGLARPALVSGEGIEPRFRFLSLADRYVLARFGGAFALILTSAVLISLVVDYADKLDEVARHHPSMAAIFGYYRYFLLSITIQIAPFAVLLATLAGLGTLSKSNEDTAFKASGLSLWRLAAPVVVAAGLGAVVAFAVGEYMLPFSEQRQERFRNEIYGRPPEAGDRGPGERNWYLSNNDEIWHHEEADAGSEELFGVSVFSFDRQFRLARRTAARDAGWTGQAWKFRDGWTRSFEKSSREPYRAFLEETIAGDPPKALAAVRRRPEEMRFRELERLTRRLSAGGFSTASLDTALQAKLAGPFLIPIMALLATPFAFRIGRRGTLAGIGLGLFLGILALIATAFSTKLGEASALPPLLAAWAPDVLFGLAGTYFLVRMRT
jgi:LPS export ABC transporter permease LptG/LPS export ABC transporter permease LptF